MDLRKTIKISELTFNKLQTIKGKTIEERIQNVLLVYANKDISESMYTRLLSAHMNDIKQILDKQEKVIYASIKETQDFIKEVKPLMKYIEKSAGGF